MQFRPFIIITIWYNKKWSKSFRWKKYSFHWFVSTLAAMVALANSLLGGMISDHGSVSDIYQIVCQHLQLSQLSSIILPPLSVIQFEFPSSSCHLMPRYFDKVGSPLFLYIKIVLCSGSNFPPPSRHSFWERSFVRNIYDWLCISADSR